MSDKPAYPFPYPGADGSTAHLGLTRREVFAAMAMQADIAESGMIGAHDSTIPQWTAVNALRYADALIAALDAEPGK